MLSGTFHVQSQNWQYSPKMQVLSQTAHLAQLAFGYTGSEVIIPDIPPTGTGAFNGFTIGTGFVPDITPYGTLEWLGTTGYMTQPNNNIPIHKAVQRRGYVNYPAAGVDNAIWGNVSGAVTIGSDPGGLMVVWNYRSAQPQSPVGLVGNNSRQINYIFKSDFDSAVDISNPGNFVFPPTNFHMLGTAYTCFFGVGNDWISDPDTLDVIGWMGVQPMELLVDNVSFPRQAAGGGGQPWGSTSFYTNAVTFFRMGDMNPNG